MLGYRSLEDEVEVARLKYLVTMTDFGFSTKQI